MAPPKGWIPPNKGRSQFSDAVVAAARRRGISIDHIAAAAGFTRQWAQRKLERWTKETGERFDFIAQPHSPKMTSWVCVVCGKQEWRIPSHAAWKYCSAKCRGQSQRYISDRKIESAITLRKTGLSWTHVAIRTGHPLQSVQRRIWAILDLSYPGARV